ncbi:unnamed protein product, partial [Callosobruchus maculatus]
MDRQDNESQFVLGNKKFDKIAKLKSEVQWYKKNFKDQQKKRADFKISGGLVDQYGIFEREKELKSLKKRKAKLRLVDKNKMQRRCK